MPRQALVIGLGQFGNTLARALASTGTEVLAVDTNPQHIADIAPFVTEAVQADAMDETALADLAPARRDLCVCAIGDDNREGSIIVTALLRQLGAPRLLARATDDLHGRILTLVGAHEVLYPERSFAERLALRLAWRNVRDVAPLGGGLLITEVAVPGAFVGRTLEELGLPRRFGVVVCAVRRSLGDRVETAVPDPRLPLGQGDVLLLVSDAASAQRLTEAV